MFIKVTQTTINLISWFPPDPPNYLVYNLFIDEKFMKGKLESLQKSNRLHPSCL